MYYTVYIQGDNAKEEVDSQPIRRLIGVLKIMCHDSPPQRNDFSLLHSLFSLKS
jgi:hypothetical protein